MLVEGRDRWREWRRPAAHSRHDRAVGATASAALLQVTLMAMPTLQIVLLLLLRGLSLPSTSLLPRRFLWT